MVSVSLAVSVAFVVQFLFAPVLDGSDSFLCRIEIENINFFSLVTHLILELRDHRVIHGGCPFDYRPIKRFVAQVVQGFLAVNMLIKFEETCGIDNTLLLLLLIIFV